MVWQETEEVLKEELTKWPTAYWKHRFNINLEKSKILNLDRKREPKKKVTMEGRIFKKVDNTMVPTNIKI